MKTAKIESRAMAWHYTTGLNARMIFDSKELRPTNSYIAPGEKPILWFSKHQFWEETANKAVQNKSGGIRILCMRETFDLGGGLFRFGIEADKISNWPRIGSEASMKTKCKKALELEGIRQGANIRDWCGVLHSVPISDCCIQRMNDDHEWEDYEPAPVTADPHI